ncbi:unnamed protein product [Lactuca virosa]|uniref:Uncharacterized protein n=1 Tax=Lactuca virosa TaxID=75947 RepID=A0AAU9LER1_9ASTR|nr:unnamed protein product [Lactuca virosa]
MKKDVMYPSQSFNFDPNSAGVTQSDLDASRQDLDWLVRVGVVRIVDKLIEHLDFTNVISLIRHAAFVAGIESVHKTSAGAGGGDVGVDAAFVGPVVSVNDALLSFASMDHASLLGLGELDVGGLRELCSFGGSEGTPESAVGQDIVQAAEVGGKKVNEGGDGDRGEGQVVVVGNEVVRGEDDVVEDAPASCATPSGA